MMSSPAVPFRVSDWLVPVIAPARAQRSAATPTTVVVLAVLFAELGSAVAENTVAVFVITVPLAVPGLTFTTSVNDAEVEAASAPIVQVWVPVPPTTNDEQLHPAAGVNERKVVFAGITSLRVTEVTVAVLVTIVPFGVAAATFTTKVIVLVPTGTDGLMQFVPVPPTGGEHVHPAPGVTETNVVPAGVASEREVFDAAFGPALVTVIVYVMFDPATTGSGESTFETERSAVAATAVTAGGNSTPTRVNAKMIQRSDAFTVAPPPRVSWSGTSSYTLVVATATAIKGVGAQRSRNRVPSCRGGKGGRSSG